jgi:hypothetical protein
MSEISYGVHGDFMGADVASRNAERKSVISSDESGDGDGAPVGGLFVAKIGDQRD